MAGPSSEARFVAGAAAFLFILIAAAVLYAASLHTPGPPAIPTTDHGTSQGGR